MHDRLDVMEIMAAYPHLEHLEDGEQAKMNHVGCQAGRDTKSRLYVKRDGHKLLMYCHNCGCSGGKGLGQVCYIRRRKNEVSDKPIHLPRDLVIDPTKCHPLMNVWLNKYGITRDEREQYSIGWSESRKRAILPVFMNDGLVAFQERRLLPQDNGPKYLTTRCSWVRHPLFQTGCNLYGGDMVLTEDILSAIKVGRVANATALLGTHMPDKALEYIFRTKPNRVLIWLDDDKPEVRVQQRRILRRLQALVTAHRILGQDVDPKELSAEQIASVLDGVL